MTGTRAPHGTDSSAAAAPGTTRAAPTRTGEPRPPRIRHRSPMLIFARTAVPLLLAVIVLSIYSNSKNPQFLTWNNYDNILSQMSVLGILAAGQTLLVIGGQLDLSVGSMVSFVAVVAAELFKHGWSTPVVVLVCLALSTGVGLVWGLVVALLRVPPFILTLGGLSIFGSAALALANNTPVSVRSGLSTLGFGSWLGLGAPALTLLVVLVVTGILLHFTRFGRNVFAFGSSPQASFVAGLPTRRLVVEMFALNGLLVGLAGLVMMARLASGDPNSGQGLELVTVAITVLGGAALVGGRGNMLGTFLATMVYGTVSAALTFLDVPGAYQSLVSGCILIFAVTATAIADIRASRVTDGPSTLATLGGQLRRLAIRRPPSPPAAPPPKSATP